MHFWYRCIVGFLEELHKSEVRMFEFGLYFSEYFTLHITLLTFVK